jgi:curved DNA-binding protein
VSRDPQPDPFEILGVGSDATDDKVKAAYYEKSKATHPDAGGDAAAFQAVTEAYATLRDPARRAEAEARAARRNAPDPFASVFGEAFAARTAKPKRRDPNNPTGKGPDIHARLDISLEEAFAGGSFFIRGRTVHLDPGVCEGMVTILKGGGETGLDGGPRGDLAVEISVKPHPRFQRRGDDLATKVEIDVWDAALGHKIVARGIDGLPVRVLVPPGTQPGSTFVEIGRGMPDGRGGLGDLRVVVGVVVPDGRDDRFAEPLRQMRAAANAQR